MNQELESKPMDSGPHPLTELVKVWLKVFRMSEAFFKEEIGRVSIPNTLISVFTLAVLSTLLSAINSVLSNALSPATVANSMSTMEATAFRTFSLILAPVCGFILIPVSFFLNTGMIYLGAQVFGGKGEFKTQAYLQSLFYVPMGLISSFLAFLGLIPKIGFILVILIILGLTVYHYILSYRVVRVVFSLPKGRAIGAILIPLAVVMIPICMVTILAAMGPIVSMIFSGIINSIGPAIP